MRERSRVAPRRGSLRQLVEEPPSASRSSTLRDMYRNPSTCLGACRSTACDQSCGTSYGHRPWRTPPVPPSAFSHFPGKPAQTRSGLPRHRSLTRLRVERRRRGRYALRAGRTSPGSALAGSTVSAKAVTRSSAPVKRPRTGRPRAARGRRTGSCTDLSAERFAPGGHPADPRRSAPDRAPAPTAAAPRSPRRGALTVSAGTLRRSALDEPASGARGPLRVAGAEAPRACLRQQTLDCSPIALRFLRSTLSASAAFALTTTD